MGKISPFDVLIDAPSALWIFGGTLALTLLVASRADTARRFRIAQAVSIPLGVLGVLVGFVFLLVKLDDPARVGPAIAQSLTPLLYGLVLHFGLRALLAPRADEDGAVGAPEVGRVEVGFRVVAAMLALVAMVFLATWLADLSAGIFGNVFALVWVALVTFALFLGGKKGARQANVAALGKYSMAAGCLGVIPGWFLICTNLNDPAAIGPGMAIALLCPFYGGLCYLLAHFTQSAAARALFPFRHHAAAGFVLTALASLVCSIVLIMSF